MCKRGRILAVSWWRSVLCSSKAPSAPSRLVLSVLTVQSSVHPRRVLPLPCAFRLHMMQLPLAASGACRRQHLHRALDCGRFVISILAAVDQFPNGSFSGVAKPALTRFRGCCTRRAGLGATNRKKDIIRPLSLLDLGRQAGPLQGCIHGQAITSYLNKGYIEELHAASALWRCCFSCPDLVGSRGFPEILAGGGRGRLLQHRLDLDARPDISQQDPSLPLMADAQTKHGPLVPLCWVASYQQAKCGRAMVGMG